MILVIVMMEVVLVVVAIDVFVYGDDYGERLFFVVVVIGDIDDN